MSQKSTAFIQMVNAMKQQSETQQILQDMNRIEIHPTPSGNDALYRKFKEAQAKEVFSIAPQNGIAVVTDEISLIETKPTGPTQMSDLIGKHLP